MSWRFLNSGWMLLLALQTIVNRSPNCKSTLDSRYLSFNVRQSSFWRTFICTSYSLHSNYALGNFLSFSLSHFFLQYFIISIFLSKSCLLLTKEMSIYLIISHLTAIIPHFSNKFFYKLIKICSSISCRFFPLKNEKITELIDRFSFY